MINYLKISNFILVEETALNLHSEFNVITGETGAGKSVIAGAIGVVFGSAINSGMLYNKNKTAKIEVAFQVLPEYSEFNKLLQKYEIDINDDNEVFFLREIYPTLKSRNFINGRRVSKSILKEFRDVLIDFHHQKEQLKLFDTEYQLELLDKYGKLSENVREFINKYNKLKRAKQNLKELQNFEEEQKEKIQLYKYQLQEIDDLDIKTGEDETIQTEINLLNHSEEILQIASEIEHRIYESDNSVYDVLNGFSASLSHFVDDNDIIKRSDDSLRTAISSLDDTVSAIREIQNVIEVDEQRLSELETRFDELNRIKLKYKMSLEELIEYKRDISKIITNFSSNIKLIEDAKKEVTILSVEAIKTAEKNSQLRKKAAKKMEAEVEKNLRKLAMPNAKVEIRFENKQVTSVEDLQVSGADLIEFYFSANAGKELQPLKIAASGGEISRFLLVIKKILSAELENKTIIFDEIDSGIGGKTSIVLGKYISDISNYHQILCISHLAQVASFAQKHFAIDKKSTNKFSAMFIKELDEKAKKKEIARMMSGSDSDLALQYAEEILKKKAGE